MDMGYKIYVRSLSGLSYFCGLIQYVMKPTPSVILERREYFTYGRIASTRGVNGHADHNILIEM
jgi:hypothetical protein